MVILLVWPTEKGMEHPFVSLTPEEAMTVEAASLGPHRSYDFFPLLMQIGRIFGDLKKKKPTPQYMDRVDKGYLLRRYV